MSGSPPEYDDRAPDSPPTSDSPCPRDRMLLESVVVRYETTADRCTITPRDCSGDDQLTTWLSADLEAFVDLGEAR